VKARNELAQYSSRGPVLATVGVFDGMHKGHQRLLQRLREVSVTRHCLSLAVTFLRHPLEVLRPDMPVAYLNSQDERLRLLSQSVDTVLPLTFDLELSLLRAGEFIELLREAIDLQGLVVGPGFAMGHNREGAGTVLQSLGKQMHFSVEWVDGFTLNGKLVSSTAIRQALSDLGSMDEVRRLLGRSYSLQGTVVKGHGRGRHLGFPTVNLAIEYGRLFPADGVYSTWAMIDGQYLPAATSIGFNSTFGGRIRTVEAHILDWDKDLYGKEIGLVFVQRIRGQLHFDSDHALIQQMERDVVQVRALLKETSQNG
jgi:riboflavin kinase/FMN adenylyltransferase